MRIELLLHCHWHLLRGRGNVFYSSLASVDVLGQHMRCIMLCCCEPQVSHAYCCSQKTIVLHAGNGREVPGAGLSDKDTGRGQPQKFVATGWFELHQLLRKHLQPNTIQLGKRFTSLADKGMSSECPLPSCSNQQVHHIQWLVLLHM